MKLYIRFGSLAKFQRLYDTSEYLQKVLSQTRSNVYSKFVPGRISLDDPIGVGTVLALKNFYVLALNGTSGFKIDLEHSARPGIASNIALISILNIPTSSSNLIAGEIYRNEKIN